LWRAQQGLTGASIPSGPLDDSLAFFALRDEAEEADFAAARAQRLIDQGRANLVLRTPLVLPFPTRFLQGTADTDVPVAVAQRLFDHASGPDIRLTLVKGADHRFSTPACLALIEANLNEIRA
jgi:pimeloyl-ACP methyl ester carboxylesterase